MHRHVIGFDGKLAAADIIAQSFYEERLNRQVEQIGIVTSASVETPDLARCRSRSFWKENRSELHWNGITNLDAKEWHDSLSEQ